MTANISSKKKLLGGALLGLGLASLLLAYYFFSTPEDSKEPQVAFGADQPDKTPSSDSLSSGSAKPEDMTENDRLFSSMSREAPVADDTGAESDARLDGAELERLNAVFRNSVYPQFQDGFELDVEGRGAIDAFIASMPEGLSSEDLDSISVMIKGELSSPEAEDVAFIITHLYRLEQEESRLMQEREPVTTMAGQMEAQEQLAELREQWLGQELSETLFSGTDDARASSDEGFGNSRATGSSSEEQPETMTDEQAELADIENAWEERYQKFLAEKQYIDNAGLDEAEKDRQIEALLRQHYEPQELEAARAFDQMRE